ncbi:ABC transporter ATP-binding protein [Trujillonella endophytica]|uniref:Peptide/nickel transport system ATP-binding protein n=1 Tax=Trujillonella endophytica TaxID=673521 RepID=A0A1H8UW68_9ACTN|nr:ABC transporter ATP-binding protein [Trujillella endophytica]SEP07415.1 peptide/nickel transport system ATP-binding protein [Trujillella endophytica]
MAGTGEAHLLVDAEGTVLSVRHLQVEYRTPGGVVHAVSDVSFDVRPGETLGLVGESGCGKSTTGKAVLRLEKLAGGQVVYRGQDLASAKRGTLRPLRRKLQMIFQDPVSSLNPRRSVRELVVEGLTIAGRPAAERREAADRVLADVGLDPERFGPLRPRQLSGGQAQRVAIARALAIRPDLIVCDEPVSALDVSVQAQIVNLLHDLKDEHALTLVFISHDLSVVRSVCDRVMVMYLGRICEVGDVDSVFAAPAHPYTRALLDSVPRRRAAGGFPGPALEGDIPSPLDPPSGCRFRTRCPLATERCAVEVPEVRAVGDGHFAACHHADAPADLGRVPVSV